MVLTYFTPGMVLTYFTPGMVLTYFYGNVSFGRLFVNMREFVRHLVGNNLQHISKIKEGLCLYTNLTPWSCLSLLRAKTKLQQMTKLTDGSFTKHLGAPGVVCPYTGGIYMNMAILFSNLFCKTDQSQISNGASMGRGKESIHTCQQKKHILFKLVVTLVDGSLL